jgi:hypothetical protein
LAESKKPNKEGKKEWFSPKNFFDFAVELRIAGENSAVCGTLPVKQKFFKKMQKNIPNPLDIFVSIR